MAAPAPQPTRIPVLDREMYATYGILVTAKSFLLGTRKRLHWHYANFLAQSVAGHRLPPELVDWIAEDLHGSLCETSQAIWKKIEETEAKVPPNAQAMPGDPPEFEKFMFPLNDICTPVEEAFFAEEWGMKARRRIDMMLEQLTCPNGKLSNTLIITMDDASADTGVSIRSLAPKGEKSQL